MTAESFLRERSDDLTADEKVFIAAGVALRERERKQDKTRMRVGAAGAAILLAGAIVATVMIQQSKEQSKDALSRQLVAQAATLQGEDPVLALLLSVEALRTSKTPEASNGLRIALDYGAIPRAVLSRHTGIVESVAIGVQGRSLASGGDDGKILLWDLKTRQSRRLPAWRDEGDPEAGSEVDGLAFSPDGKLLASGVGSAILLWDLTAPRLVGRPIFGHRKQVESLAFSPDGRLLASSGDDGRVFLWDVATGRLVRNLVGHTGEVDSVAFSPDGRVFASAGEDKNVFVWSVETGLLLRILSTERIESVAFSPDGETLALGSDEGRITFWDMKNGNVLFTRAAHGGEINSLAFSPDGRLLASGSSDQSIRLWGAGDLSPFGPALIRHQGPIESVAFAPDSKTLASSGADKTVLLWEVTSAGNDSTISSLNDWTARACQVAQRNLRQDEWRRYLPDEPYRETCPGFTPSASP